eukprot:SM000168S02642  [mRNA]  locus=s168:204781:205094:+ [translate_table: standard]
MGPKQVGTRRCSPRPGHCARSSSSCDGAVVRFGDLHVCGRVLKYQAWQCGTNVRVRHSAASTQGSTGRLKRFLAITLRTAQRSRSGSGDQLTAQRVSA